MNENVSNFFGLALMMAGIGGHSFRGHRCTEKSVSAKIFHKPKGQKYTYPDGFECYAMNLKNADRKHNNFLISIQP